MKPGLPSFLLMYLISISALCQEPIYKTYKWESNPMIHVLSKDMLDYPAVYISHHRFLELRVAGVAESYFTEHKIIHLTSAAGIEKFNKVYIPLRANQTLVSLEVRAINPNGGITYLRQENLKELHNVEGYGNFKIFAVEGVTVGGEIEYIYTTKSSPQSFGSYKVQSEIPVMEASIIVLYPEKYRFGARSYNGLARPTIGEFNAKQQMIELTAVNIPALKEEKFSAYPVNLMRLDFKMESDMPSNSVDWEGMSGRIVKNSYDVFGAIKVKKMLKSLNLDGLDQQQQVQAIEKHLKSNFTIKENNNPEYDDVKEIVEKHVGSEQGILKVYMGCWEQIGVLPQLVVCSNRFRGKIDPDFAMPSQITDLIFYFPKWNKYLSPSVSYSRLGPVPEVLTGKAIFIDYSFKNHAIIYDRYNVKNILPLDYTHNEQGTKISLKFNGNLGTPEVEQEESWQGYRAAMYRGIYNRTKDDKREDLIKNIVLSGMDNVTISKLEMEGEDMNLSFDPDIFFKAKVHYTVPSLIDHAGEDYLLAVGKLIGRQSEIYEDKKRETEIEFTSVTNYKREILIEIPDGYTCSGLEAIKINNVLTNGTEDIMKFQSDYRLDGNKLTITADEFYKVLKLTKSDYEQFRKVVNSAADFNKLVLVLSPKTK